MKHHKTIIMLFAGALAFTRPPGHSTANAAATGTDSKPSEPDPKEERIAELEAQVKALAQQLAPKPEPEDSTLSLLAKGAGVPLDDVRWRVRAGLSPKQAVDAAVAQIASDKQAEEAAKAAAAEKETNKKGSK